jgi:glycosyltransferase involved in cell wall biosynthesis
MRVVVDATALGSQRGGDETFLRGMLRGLVAAAGDDDRFTLLVAGDGVVPTEVARAACFEPHAVRRRPGAWHFGVTLPTVLSARVARGQDLVFTITHAPAWSPIPTVLTVGDCSFRHHPELYPASARARLNVIVPRQARRARAVVAPSEFSRCDLIDCFDLPEDRVFVVPNVVERAPPLGEATCARVHDELARAGVWDRFVLYLGNVHPRKNVARLVDAFTRARTRHESVAECQLVVAGASWFGDDSARAAVARAPAGSVIALGRVDPDCRQYLLESAVALAYPSLFEGFGLPPVEAMAVGTPTLVSDRAALPEVTGDAALAIDPLDIEAIADGIVRIVSDENLRCTLRVRGLERVQRYTHEVAGAAAVAAFTAALD